MAEMAEPEILERHRLVADAIILERAAGVVRRRGNDGFAVRVLVRTLNRMGARLREKAGHA
jgi:hypothetical protein